MAAKRKPAPRSKKPSATGTTNKRPVVAKQTIGGIVGATIGGVVAGPIGAFAGGLAGALVGESSDAGNRPMKRAVEATSQIAAKPMKRAVGGVKKALPAKKSAKKQASRKARSSK